MDRNAFPRDQWQPLETCWERRETSGLKGIEATIATLSGKDTLG